MPGRVAGWGEDDGRDEGEYRCAIVWRGGAALGAAFVCPAPRSRIGGSGRDVRGSARGRGAAGLAALFLCLTISTGCACWADIRWRMESVSFRYSGPGDGPCSDGNCANADRSVRGARRGGVQRRLCCRLSEVGRASHLRKGPLFARSWQAPCAQLLCRDMPARGLLRRRSDAMCGLSPGFDAGEMLRSGTWGLRWGTDFDRTGREESPAAKPCVAQTGGRLHGACDPGATACLRAAVLGRRRRSG